MSVLYKNAVGMHLCQYLENSWCPPHLKKDMVELNRDNFQEKHQE